MSGLLLVKITNSAQCSGFHQYPWARRFRKTTEGQEVELEEDAEKENNP